MPRLNQTLRRSNPCNFLSTFCQMAAGASNQRTEGGSLLPADGKTEIHAILIACKTKDTLADDISDTLKVELGRKILACRKATSVDVL